MKLLKLFFFLIVSVTSFSQELKIDTISLSYDHSSAYFGPMNEVSIVFAINDAYIGNVTVYITIDKKKKDTFEISREKFKEISDDILIIKPKDFLFDEKLLFPLDAPTISLSFGYFTRSITYAAYGLSKNEENSTRKDFLKIIQKILEIADVKIVGIN